MRRAVKVLLCLVAVMVILCVIAAATQDGPSRMQIQKQMVRSVA